MWRLRVEFFMLYVALPILLLGARRVWGGFDVRPVLWVAAAPAACALARCYGWDKSAFFGCRLTRYQARALLIRVMVAAAGLTIGLLLISPGQLFSLPRHDWRLWLLVLWVYPLVSVYPQGILYRGLFYARYAVVFRSERQAWLVGAAVFSLAHLVFANGWALLLTLLGGFLINRTYRRSGSLMASALEHMVYGQLVFTIGWGRYLYHGSAQILDRI